MSLIKCPVCDQEISNQAVMCVKCGNPIRQSTGSQQKSENAAWNAVTKSRTPINVFSLAMMACSAILGVSATQVGNTFSLNTFTYTLHIFLAVSGMFFSTILFCRKGMYHPEDLVKAKEAGAEDLGQDKPILAATLIFMMVIAYGVYQWRT